MASLTKITWKKRNARDAKLLEKRQRRLKAADKKALNKKLAAKK
jgi:hypothetical protein